MLQPGWQLDPLLSKCLTGNKGHKDKSFPFIPTFLGASRRWYSQNTEMAFVAVGAKDLSKLVHLSNPVALSVKWDNRGRTDVKIMRQRS